MAERPMLVKRPERRRRSAPAARPGSVESRLQDLARRVPAEVWATLPQDLADQVDHYVYGTPRR